MKIYQHFDSHSTYFSGPRQSAACPPSFARFAGRRSFPPVPVSREIRPAKRAYFALPLKLFDTPVADQALALASQYSETIFDPRYEFSNNNDWRKRCGHILRGCDAIFVLLTSDRELPAGCYTEVAYAYALGLPVHVISWRLRGKPKLELGGELVSLWNGTMWRAAGYRPAEELTRRLSWETLRQQFPWLTAKTTAG